MTRLIRLFDRAYNWILSWQLYDAKPVVLLSGGFTLEGLPRRTIPMFALEDLFTLRGCSTQVMVRLESQNLDLLAHLVPIN